MSPTTASNAADHVIRMMDIRDPEEQLFTRQVAVEQQSVLDAVRGLNNGSIVGNLSQLPVNSAVVWPQGEDVRYLVVVKMRDRETGATKETMHEIYSDVPILPTDVKNRAVDLSRQGMGQDTITSGLGPDVIMEVSSVVIVSASKRG